MKHPLIGRKQTAEHIKNRFLARVKNGNAKWPVKINCAACGREFFLKPHLAGRVKNCSKTCGYKYKKITGVTAGENHPMWIGGEVSDNKGYVQTRVSDGRKYVFTHRLVFERLLGRRLEPKEIVHHWDENKLNNNRDNLALLRSNSAHRRLHGFAERHNLHVQELKFGQPWLEPI